MVIIHIANVDTSVIGGVQLAVPKMVKAQSEYADVGFVNTHGDTVCGIQMLKYDGELDISRFQKPFDKPDIVVFHEVYRIEYIKIYIYLKKLGIPYIVVPHGSLSQKAQQKKRLKKTVANILLFNGFIKNSRAVQYLSENEKKMSVFPKEECFVSGSGIAIPDAYKTGFSENGMRFVYIGRLEIHIKGLDLLLRAVKMNEELMRKSFAEVKIFGPDYNESHKKITHLIEELNISDLVTLGKEKTGEEKKAILLSSDCFIQASRTEGLPLGVLEALGHGLPCIVTEGVGLGELIESYGAGYKCATTSEGIAEAMKSLIAKRECMSSMSTGAVRAVKENYDINAIAEKTIAVYRKIVRG